MIVATGERSVFPNVGPTTRQLCKGDICRMEIFPMIDGYHVGVCRTPPSAKFAPEAARIWANLTACKHLLLDIMKPARVEPRHLMISICRSCASLACRRSRSSGMAWGCICTEDPYLGPTPDQPLEPGMVLAFEPLVFETGYDFGMQIKDVVLITDTGCELMSNFTDNPIA